MKNIILQLLIVLSPLLLSSQVQIQNNAKINWLTIQEAVKLQEENPKTILIDMYTDWCGWCKKMDAETFDNPNIANYINTYYYPVKFDAEGKDTIVFRGQTYTSQNLSQRSTHQLANFLMNGRMSYPTIVYIDYEFNINPVPGFMNSSTIEPLLIYFSERINKNADYSHFAQDFKNTYDPDSTAKVDGNINWLNIDAANMLIKEKPKKMLVFINSEYNNGSKIMLASSFRHPVISNYINENFYPVKFNYDTKDSVSFLGNIFINEQKAPGYPNQLAIALLQPDIRLPSIVFFDEKLGLIFALRGYYPPQTLERYLDFIGNDLYKNGTDWMKFNESFKSKLD